MKVHEYQAKALLTEYGITVPPGKVAESAAEARRIASELSGKVIVKAQIYAGGRGKAGGVKIANDRDEAEKLAAGMIDTRLVTGQTSSSGSPVRKVLVEKVMPVSRELYISIVVDNKHRMPVIIASEAGGMDIEQVSRTNPEKILKAYIDPATGFQDFVGRRLAYGMNLSPDQVKAAVRLMANLYRLFEAKDCSLAEINPLVVTAEGGLMALDAKLNFDDSALFRHDDIRQLHDAEQDDPYEAIAHDLGIRNYIKLDGNIGCAVNGAGLAMAVLDMIKLAGGNPANFLDFGTVNNTAVVVNAFKVFNSDPSVKAILVNIFGGISRADIVASGLVEACTKLQVKVPLLVRLAGTNVAEGKQILAGSGVQYIEAADLFDAAQKAVAAAGK